MSKANKSTVVKHPIEDFCKKNFNEKELNAIVKKAITFTSLLETVKYKDGSGKASDFVVKCAIVPYITQMESRPKRIGDYQKDFINTKFVSLADNVADVLDSKTFTKMLEKIAKDADCKLPQCFIPLCRFGTPEQIKYTISRMKKWADWDTHGSAGRSAIIVLRGALMLSDHPLAVQLAEKGGYFSHFANIRGLTEQEYRDEKSLPELGFDSDGVKRYVVDGKTFEVRISAALTLEITQDGKIVKSISKKTPDGEAAAADFAVIKKEFADFIKKRTEYIKSIYINGETIAAEAWLKTYGSKQILLPFAERVIWQNGSNTFFEVTGGKIRDINGNDFTPTEPVRIAHVLDMTKDEIEQWQARIIALQKALLIEQVWEPMVELKKGADICTIYDGAVLTKQERNEFKRLLKAKAITVKSMEQHAEFNHRNYSYNFSNSNTMLIASDIQLDYVVDENTGDITLGKMNGVKLNRTLNTVVFELDRLCTRHHIVTDNTEAISENILSRFTLAQIMEFVDLAVTSNSTNCTALLMDYRNKTFNEVDPFSMFVL